MAPEKRSPDPRGVESHEGDPDAPASPAEVTAAEALRDALADPSRDHEGAALLRAVAQASAPTALDDDAHREIIARALASRSRSRVPSQRQRVWSGAAIVAGLALAASIMLVIGRPDDAPRARAVPLAPARSTQPLFAEPFARHGGESARIDRIARARASDLRDNRFAMRGVR